MASTAPSAKLDIAAIRSRLKGRDVEYFATIDSTMRAASEGSRKECPAGTVFLAERQTKGVGRMGRRWHSSPGDSLTFSMVLRPRMGTEKMPVLTLAVGVAVTEAVEEVTGLKGDLRWPNDLLFEGRKVCGVLLELQRDSVSVGVGLNVNQQEFPKELAETATSLLLAGGGKPQNREDLICAIVPRIEQLCELLVTEGARPILDLFESHSSFVKGRLVQVDHDGQVVKGTTVGLDPSGFLRLRTEDGAILTLVAGGVRPSDS